MSPAEAARLLELPADATPEQIEARFLELRRKLEDKIARAPTPGLQAKYRESLTETTTAFETLALAADSSSLPVLAREKGEGKGEKGEGRREKGKNSLPATTGPDPAPSSLRPSPPARSKSGREFVLVAIIAVVVLGAGGWFVMKTRAENAEKARLAAETERQVEARKKADEEEKARIAAEARAEQERLDRLSAKVRTQIAELRIAWEAMEQQARQLERKVSDLKSEERSLNTSLKGETTPELRELRDGIAGHEELLAWLGHQLLRHPAKVARAQAEELLSARQIEEGAATIERAATEQARLEQEFAGNQRVMLSTTGLVSLKAGQDPINWTLTDAYGRETKGTGQFSGRSFPAGPLKAELAWSTFDPRQFQLTVSRGEALEIDPEFKIPRVFLDTFPQGAEVWFNDRSLGKTPLADRQFMPGTYDLELRLPDREAVKLTVALPEGFQPRLEVVLPHPRSGVAGISFASRHISEFYVDALGYHVVSVVPGGPADRAGLRPGDIIHRVIRPDGTVFEPTFNRDIDLVAALSGEPGEERVVHVADDYPALPPILDEEEAGAGGAAETPVPPPVPEVVPTREVRLVLQAHAEVQAAAERAAAAMTKPSPPRAGKPHTNSLGMRFVPLPPWGKPLMAVWETRVQDFEAFVRETGRKWTRGQNDGPEHPAANVSVEDARAFCLWLTQKERAAGLLTEDQSYELPDETAWQIAVGWREFPWGWAWPPPKGAGNLADETAAAAFPTWKDAIIAGYEDGAARAAPVGSYPPNQYGLHDLAGNVAEFTDTWGTVAVRGSAFNVGVRSLLASRARDVVPATPSPTVGFRVVITDNRWGTPMEARLRSDGRADLVAAHTSGQTQMADGLGENVLFQQGIPSPFYATR